MMGEPANSEPVMQLGDVFEIHGKRWMVLGWTDVSWRLVRMPDGETTQGLGRTWFDDGTHEDMLLPRASVDRATRVQ